MKIVIVSVVLVLCCVDGEKLSTKSSKENSNAMRLSTFGYIEGGYFAMNMSLTLAGKDVAAIQGIGLRFDKSGTAGLADYMDLYGKCPLDIFMDKTLTDTQTELSRAVLLFLAPAPDKAEVKIFGHKMSNLIFFRNESEYVLHVAAQSTNAAAQSNTEKPDLDETNVTKHEVASPVSKELFPFVKSLPAKVEVVQGKVIFNTSVYFKVETTSQTGLYELYLHNCNRTMMSSVKIDIESRNVGSFLSAGKVALPTVYAVMAAVFFLISLIWAVVLWKNRSQVFKIHYLMAIFIIIKALSVTFHSIDYHFIGLDGKPEGWAVIFYIIHLLKGTLLFICLLLIGTGWAFIKYVLTDREKKLFMIVIPLQIIANIAFMIQGEQPGNMTYNSITWTQVMFLIDILCFGIILISVVWSVRHLQQAATTDGKAAVSLIKLKLFQHFYIMVICYLYFRRVLVYMLEVTVSFRYTWIAHLFLEVVSLIFFVVTGYKFRPGCDNPYLAIPQEDIEDVESEALTGSGLTENIVKVNRYEKNQSGSDDDDDDDDDEEVVLLQRNRTTML